MTQSKIQDSGFSLPRRFLAAWDFNPLLSIFVLFHAALAVVGFVGIAADPREILNSPVWAKTTKFALSLFIYGASLLWMLTFLKSKPRASRFLGAGISVVLFVEIALILIQNILRGVPVHFNQATTFDTIMWRVMSGGIMVFYLLDIAAAIFLLREKIENRAVAWSIRLGMLLAIVGFGLGFLMTGPTATQLAALEAGKQIDMMGAHNVGAFVDGQTRMIPFLGWNMDGGDLRIPHFVGIHGLQFVPLIALIASRMKMLSERRRLALVGLGASFYFGLTMLVTWQALRNQSIIAPDALTLLAFGALLIVFGGFSAWLVLSERKAETRLSR